MSVRRACFQSSTAVFLGCLLLLFSCNSSKFSADPAPAGLPETTSQPVHREFSLELALDQLAAMQAPPGTDQAVFSTIKEAMQAALTQTGADKWISTPPTGLRNQVWDLADSFTQDGERAVQWNYLNTGDYDLNSQVNVSDITPIAIHFNKTKDSPDWETAAKYVDGDGNGEVNVADITPIAQNFLATVSAWRLIGSDSEDGPFAPVQEVPFAAGEEIEPSGQRCYNIAPESEYSFYRVTPLDETGNAGQESLTSRGLILFDNVIILNQEGGLAFSDWPEWDTITLQAPSGDPADLEIGDIVISNDMQGVLFAVDSFTQDGSIVTAKGHRPYLTEVVVQGALDINYVEQPPAEAAGAKVTSDGPYLHLDLSGEQILSNDARLNLNIYQGYIDFLPSISFKFSYNRELGLVFFHSSVTYQKFDYYMTYQQSSNDYRWYGGSGESDRYARHIIGFPLIIRTEHNGFPIAAQANFNVDLAHLVKVQTPSRTGIAGTRIWTIDGSFDGLKYGLEYRYGAWNQINDLNWAFGNVNTPIVNDPLYPYEEEETTVETTMRYVLQLYHSNWVDWPSYEAVNYWFIPKSKLIAYDAKEVDTYEYGLRAELRREAELRFTLFSHSEQVSMHQENWMYYKKGKFNEPGESFSLSGRVTHEGSGDPLAGVSLAVKEFGTTQVGSDISESEGYWAVTGLKKFYSYTVTPLLEGYLFEPPQHSVLLEDHTDGLDFVARDNPNLHNLTGLITGDPVDDVDVTIYDNSTDQILSTLNTYDTGGYSALNIPDGTEVRVVPSKPQIVFTPPSAVILMDGDKVQDFEADTSFQSFAVSGTVTSGGSPLVDVDIEVRDSTSNDLYGSDTTDASGTYSVGSILTGTEVIVTPEKFGYSFTPPNATLLINADKVQDFTAEQTSSTDWFKTCGGIGYERVNAISYAPNSGGLQVIGGQLSNSGEGEFIGFVEQRNDNGSKLWHYHYAPPAGSQYCWINDVVVHPQTLETYCVGVAIPNGSTQEKLWFLHLDWQLHVLESYTWPDADVTARGSGIEIDTSGGSPYDIYITGDYSVSADPLDRGPLAMKLAGQTSNDSTIVWSKMLGLDKASYVYASALDNDNNLAFVGDYSNASPSFTDQIVGKINSDGTLKWAGVYDVGNASTYSNGICIGPSNEVYYCGNWQSAGFLMRINDSGSSGTLSWAREFEFFGESWPPTSFNDCRYDTANSAILVCGTQAHPTETQNVASLLRFDADALNLLDGLAWTHNSNTADAYFSCMEYIPAYGDVIMLGGWTESAAGTWQPATGTLNFGPSKSTKAFSSSLQDLSHSFVEYAVIDDFQPAVVEGSGGGSEDAINARISNFAP